MIKSCLIKPKMRQYGCVGMLTVDTKIWYTGLSKKASARLCETCRQAQAEVVNSSRNRIHLDIAFQPSSISTSLSSYLINFKCNSFHTSKQGCICEMNSSSMSLLDFRLVFSSFSSNYLLAYYVRTPCRNLLFNLFLSISSS